MKATSLFTASRASRFPKGHSAARTNNDGAREHVGQKKTATEVAVDIAGRVTRRRVCVRQIIQPAPGRGERETLAQALQRTQ
jgi:hypothetical protein